MAHDPSLGFADYFSAADAAAASLMPQMDEGAPELYGLQSGMELLGMRGLHAAAMSGAMSVSADVHCDGGGDGHDGSTMRFFLEQQQQHEASAASWMLPHEHEAATYAHGHGAAWPLRSSRFLLPAQQLLPGYCSLPVDLTPQRGKQPPEPQQQQQQQQQQDEAGGGEVSSSSTSGWTPSAQIQAMEALELKRLKDRLYVMLEEVDRRYRRYCEQMRGLAGGFEAVAGERAASGYTAVAARTISRHFRSLRDGIVAQLQAVRKALGEKDVAPPGMTRGDTPRLKVLDQCIRQQKAMHQNGGMMMDSHPWRPQRGLPERAVTILRAWLFEHFLNPYPSDVDKHILARQTGLSRSQVSNWFINARVRLWKPMGQGGFGGGAGGVSLTLGLQQHDTHGGVGGVNIAFGAPSSAQHGAGGFLFPGEQMDGVGLHPSGGHGQNIQFGMDGAAEGSSHGVQDQHYRAMSAGFHLLRDLAG
uniref:BEL1-like homeodomain protein 4 n=1 Tax=Aegilops tauschii TaxID=37682 RepID=M8AU03_AEGTA